jgi:hypothetical protein
MKVFLMIRFNEVPLLISFLATMCRPIGSLVMNGKFLSDSSVSGWSCGPNEMPMSDRVIILPGLMR